MIITTTKGWRVVHFTDRSIELRKDDYAYRRVTGRDGYVRIRGEPGMDREVLVDEAFTLALKNDELLAERLAKDLVPRRLGGYQMKQRQLAWGAFGTPEDPEVIGVKRA